MSRSAGAIRPLVCCAAAVGLIAAGAMAAGAGDKDKTFDRTTPPTPAVAAPPAANLPAATAAPMAPALGQGNRQARRHATPQKYAAALKRWAVRAARGDPRAQLYLGRRYRRAKDTRANTRRALHWLRAAARANLPAAHYQLGLLYMAGIDGKPPNLVETYAQFKIASDAGDVRATALVFYIGVRMTADELRRAHERIAEIERYEHMRAARRTVTTAPKAAPTKPATTAAAKPARTDADEK